MPKIRTVRTKKYPKGWELIESTLLELQNLMRDAENESHEGKRKVETSWKIYRLHHQRSRYIYELYYKKKEISRELYEYCLNEKWADAMLIAKWKKAGYEKLCCLQCIQTRNHNFGGSCICRVPKSKLEEGKLVECTSCGCRGCASGDSMSKQAKDSQKDDRIEQLKRQFEQEQQQQEQQEGEEEQNNENAEQQGNGQNEQEDKEDEQE